MKSKIEYTVYFDATLVIAKLQEFVTTTNDVLISKKFMELVLDNAKIIIEEGRF